MSTEKNVRIKQRIDTKANWENENPILLPGELAIASDGYTIKVGNQASGSYYAATPLYASRYITDLEINGSNSTYQLRPFDSSYLSEYSNNSWNFLKPGGINIEYSNDSGETWLDYGATDLQKTALVTTDCSTQSSFFLGKKSTQATTTDLLRVTITTKQHDDLTTFYYGQPERCLINVGGSNPTDALFVTIQRLQNGNTDWTTIVSKQNLRGDSGWNAVTIPYCIMHPSHTSFQTNNSLRFIFSTDTTANNYSPNINKIAAITTRMWASTEYVMNNKQKPYSILANQIVNFSSNFPINIDTLSVNNLTNNDLTTAKNNISTLTTNIENLDNNIATLASDFNELEAKIPSAATTTPRNIADALQQPSIGTSEDYARADHVHMVSDGIVLNNPSFNGTTTANKIQVYTSDRLEEVATIGQVQIGRNNSLMTDTIAFGHNNTANSLNDIVIGQNNILNGEGHYAFGEYLDSTMNNQSGAVYLGKYNEIPEEETNDILIVGNGTSDTDRSNVLRVDSNNNLIIGRNNDATYMGNGLMVGYNNTHNAFGSNDFALVAGHDLIDTNYTPIVLGYYNNDSLDGADATLMVVGNGSYNERSNAMVLYENGDLNVSGDIIANNTSKIGDLKMTYDTEVSDSWALCNGDIAIANKKIIKYISPTMYNCLAIEEDDNGYIYVLKKQGASTTQDYADFYIYNNIEDVIINPDNYLYKQSSVILYYCAYSNYSFQIANWIDNTLLIAHFGALSSNQYSTTAKFKVWSIPQYTNSEEYTIELLDEQAKLSLGASWISTNYNNKYFIDKTKKIIVTGGINIYNSDFSLLTTKNITTSYNPQFIYDSITSNWYFMDRIKNATYGTLYTLQNNEIISLGSITHSLQLCFNNYLYYDSGYINLNSTEYNFTSFPSALSFGHLYIGINSNNTNEKIVVGYTSSNYSYYNITNPSDIQEINTQNYILIGIDSLYRGISCVAFTKSINQKYLFIEQYYGTSSILFTSENENTLITLPAFSNEYYTYIKVK